MIELASRLTLEAFACYTILVDHMHAYDQALVDDDRSLMATLPPRWENRLNQVSTNLFGQGKVSTLTASSADQR